MRRFSFFLLLLIAALFAVPQGASAGGFYLTDRGVRPLGRGGAFVAGAEGLESLWYNPAGLKGAGRTLRAEASVTLMRADFRRVDDSGEWKQKVELDVPVIPVPLLGYTDNFGLEDWSFALGLFAPNAQTYNWPKSVNGEAAPQRYSLISTDKSLIVHLAAGIAWHGVKGLSLGLAPTLITGRFRTATVFSACDNIVCAFPEDPEFDAPGTVDLNPFFALSLGFGATYEYKMVKVGASFNTPYTISGDAKLEVTLPDNPLFDEAYVDGDKVKLNVPFPFIGRLGVQISPSPELRVEVASVYEGWSTQDEIKVVPQNVTMRNIFGVGDYEVGNINLKRGMSDTISARLGGEYDFSKIGLTLRAGAHYETSAFSDKVLSPLTLDSQKLILGVGLGARVHKRISLDLVVGHVFLQDRQIRNSTLRQPTAIRPTPGDAPHIANGDYTMEADYFGLGATVSL